MGKNPRDVDPLLDLIEEVDAVLLPDNFRWPKIILTEEDIVVGKTSGLRIKRICQKMKAVDILIRRFTKTHDRMSDYDEKNEFYNESIWPLEDKSVRLYRLLDLCLRMEFQKELMNKHQDITISVTQRGKVFWSRQNISPNNRMITPV